MYGSSTDILTKKKDSNHGYWSEIIPQVGNNEIPCPRSMHAGAVWHSNLYIFGGYDGRQRSNDLHMYNFPLNSWLLLFTGGTVPSRRDRHTAVVYLNLLVIFGGYDGRARVNDIHTLNLETDTWSVVDVFGMQDVPSPRHSHASVVYGDSMYIFGGYDGSYCGDFYKFSFVTNTWSQVRTSGEAPSPRYRVTCVIHGDHMILHGGHDGTRHLNETYTFYFPTLTWTPFSSLGVPPSPRDSHVGVIIKSCMYIFGGSTGGALEDFHCLDLVSKMWSHVTGSTGGGATGPWSSNSLGAGTDIAGAAVGAGVGQRSSEPPGPAVSARVWGALLGGAAGTGTGGIVERPVTSPGHRFCHIAVVYNGSLYSFGGYDGSRRLNDFLKYTFLPFPAAQIPSSTLVQDMKGLLRSDLHSDITFLAEGRKIHAHKILCMRCPFFHNMLTGEFMESREAEIEISDVTYETFLSLLEFLYSDHVDLDGGNAMELFQAADRFGVDRLKRMCECVLASLLDVEGAADLLVAGDSFHGSVLRAEALSYTVKFFDAVSRTKGFEDLCRGNLDLLFEILKLR